VNLLRLWDNPQPTGIQEIANGAFAPERTHFF